VMSNKKDERVISNKKDERDRGVGNKCDEREERREKKDKVGGMR
jgi:hypothetical protein